MRNTLLRAANACFVLLVLVPVVTASVTATVSNRSANTDQPNESLQISVRRTTDTFSPTRVDRPVITIGVSPFNALGRREMSEYQHIDLNVAAGPARAGCIGDGCDEKAPHVTPPTRALGQDKKCKGKNKGKPEEECEERDEDGCCVDEEDGSSSEAKNEGDRDGDNDGDEKKTSDSDEKQSGGDSNENGKGDKEKKESESKEKKEAEAKKKKEDEEKERAKEEAKAREKEEEAREKAGAKEAKKKAEAEAKAKKKEEEDEEKRLDEEAKAKREVEKEAKMKVDDDVSNNDGSKDKAQRNKGKNEGKSTDGGNGSVQAKPSEPSRDKASEPTEAKESQPSKDDAEKKVGNTDELKMEGEKSKDGSKSDNSKGNSLESKDKISVESKELGDTKKKSDKVDIGDSIKSKRDPKPKVGGPNEAKDDTKVAEEKNSVQTVFDANHISEGSKAKPMAKPKADTDDGHDNGADVHSPNHSSQSLRSNHPRSKLNGRPGSSKSPKEEEIVNKVDTSPSNGGGVLSFSRNQKRGDNHGKASRKSSKQSSSVGPGISIGSSNVLGQSHHPPPPTNQRPGSEQSSPSQNVSNRNSQPDLHSPGGPNDGSDNRGPVPICLSNCGMRARTSMRECKATIKARSQHNVEEECNALSEILFDDCAYDCIQARGGPGSTFPHDRPRWPRPGGGGNGHRPGGKPHHPGDRPRSTPGGGNESDRSRPRPEPDRPGRGDDADEGADSDCIATCWSEDRRIKRRWCHSRSCPTWVDDYLQLCIRECQSTDEGSDSDGGDAGSPSNESNGCDRCSEQKAEKFQWCKGLTGQQRSRKGIDTCTPWSNDWYEHCLRRCHGDENDDSGSDPRKSENDLDPLQANAIICKASCKSNARIKESSCNVSSKDERKERGISEDDCSDWADELRLKCYDSCYENAKVVEGESITKEEDDEKSSDNKSKNSGNHGGGQNDAPAKQEPQKAEKEQRQDHISKAQDTRNNGDGNKGKYSNKKEVPLKDIDSSGDRPWIDNKISDPENKDEDYKRPQSNAGASKPKPPPHPHLPGINEDLPPSTQNKEQGSLAATSQSNPVDISNDGVDIDSFTVNLSIALRSGEGPETIKVRSNAGSVRADQENLRNRLLIQDGVIRVLRHIMEEELGYHIRQEEWNNRLRRLRQRELVTLHHDIDQTTAHTINLGATSRDGAAVKWIKFSVVYDIVDFLTNDHSSLITGLDVTVRSAGSSQASHLHAQDQQPHLLLTGWQIASAARAAVVGRIRDGTLLQLLRFRGVDALAITEFGDEASVSFDQGWIDEMPTSSRSQDNGIPVTAIGARTNTTGQSWDASHLVGAGVFVLVFGVIVGSAQWAWNRRRQRREMEWTTAGAQEHFHTDNVEYEEWQTRLSPGEGTPSESGGSMIIDVANAIQCDKISSLGIGTASEASVIGWRPRGGRCSRAPSNFSSIVHNAYDSVSPSDAALDLVGGELNANSQGQLV